MSETIRKIQCGGCGKFFVGTSYHEMHRKGDYSTRTSRHCMTTEEMREVGMDCEKKQVRFVADGKPYFEEHDVWFAVADRERAIKHFGSQKQEDEEEV